MSGAQTVSMTAGGHTANSTGSPLNDFWYMGSGFVVDWNAVITLDGSGNAVANGGNVTTVPDHSGNGYAATLQGDVAPVWHSSGDGAGGAIPYIAFTAADNDVGNTSVPIWTGGNGEFFVAGLQSVNSGNQYVLNGGTINNLTIVAAGLDYEIYPPFAAGITLTLSTDYGLHAVVNGASSSMSAQGQSNTGTATTSGVTAGLTWGDGGGFGAPLQGNGAWLVAYPSSAFCNTTCVTNWASYETHMGYTP
jgi:hypothetical protein